MTVTIPVFHVSLSLWISITEVVLKQIMPKIVEIGDEVSGVQKTYFYDAFGNVSDRRARLRARPGTEELVYGQRYEISNPARILYETNGMIFPYTPKIVEKHDYSYTSNSPVHFIQEFLFYSRSRGVSISVTGTFTAQNVREGRYLAGVIHFLRRMAKMNIGENDENRGLPPPILLFDAYGNYAYNSLPVILRNFSFSFDSNVDYMRVDLLDDERTERTTNLKASDILVKNANKEDIFGFDRPSKKTQRYMYVPVIMTIGIDLKVQIDFSTLRKKFTLKDFMDGKLLGPGEKGFI